MLAILKLSRSGLSASAHITNLEMLPMPGVGIELTRDGSQEKLTLTIPMIHPD